MSESFYNPYQFVPVNTRYTEKVKWQHVNDISKKTNQSYRHDYWVKKTLSGRITCRVSLESPLIVGSEQITFPKHLNRAGIVNPYCLPDGRYAIPANSLRGMIASIAETISQSSMRVLNDSIYEKRIKDIQRSREAGRYVSQKVPFKHSVYSGFQKTLGIDALPWHKDRVSLTPAELLFGFVEDEPNMEKHGGARNLASRVRFTDALPLVSIDQVEKTVTLKILASPKPPSPAMYFGTHNKYLNKTKLELDTHKPNGRKFYLPNPATLSGEKQQGKYLWETREHPQHDKNLNQKLRCRPLLPENKAGENASFEFHLHFDNLTTAELGLLYTALHPDEQFIHRLGLGKPLGLGHIKLSIEAIETIDRKDRYSLTGLNNHRYTPYHSEHDLSLINTSALQTLTTLANPDNIHQSKGTHAPVCYPYLSYKGQRKYNEKDGFRWFVNNDGNSRYGGQYIENITKGKKLPTLLESCGNINKH